MIVRFTGKSNSIALLHGKSYSVISVESEWYRIVDESGEDYLYPPYVFEIIEPASNNSAMSDDQVEKE